MKHFSGGGAWNLIPFVGGVKPKMRQTNMLQSNKVKNRGIESRQRQKVYWQRHLLTKKAHSERGKRNAEQSSQSIWKVVSESMKRILSTAFWVRL